MNRNSNSGVTSKFYGVVAKFGGTSMANADAMRKSAEIVIKNPSIKLVVVSATSGSTNQLVNIYNLCCKARSDRLPDTSPAGIESQIQLFEEKHDRIAQDLGMGSSGIYSEEFNLIKDLYCELRLITEELTSGITKSGSGTHGYTASDKQFDWSELQLRLLDQVLSIGERVSSILFAVTLRTLGRTAEVYDIRKVMITDDHFGKAEPDILEIERKCKSKLLPLVDSSSEKVFVTQGFIGSTREGETTTLGRGGSDYSAALLAEGLEASELQIWTDVPGIFTIDPNLAPQARVIEKISFAEAAELANFGAKVLHPATLWPAIRKNIRVFVGSTFQPEKGGTWIYPDAPVAGASEDGPLIRAIALRKNQTLITVTSLRMLNAHGFLAKLFGVLANHRLSVDLVTTSEVSVALTIDGTSLGSSGKTIREYREMFDELSTFSDVKVEENLTLVALIGNRLTDTSGLSARAFQAISRVNVRMICHGASSYNLCFLVSAGDAFEVVKKLHTEFVE